LTAFFTASAFRGYLYESYNCAPYAARNLVPEAFSPADGHHNGVTKPVELLRWRLRTRSLLRDCRENVKRSRIWLPAVSQFWLSNQRVAAYCRGLTGMPVHNGFWLWLAAAKFKSVWTFNG